MDNTACFSDYEEYTSESGGTSTEDTSPGSESSDYDAADAPLTNTREARPAVNKSPEQLACVGYDKMITYIMPVVDTSSPTKANGYDVSDATMLRNGTSKLSYFSKRSKQISTSTKTNTGNVEHPCHTGVGNEGDSRFSGNISIASNCRNLNSDGFEERYATGAFAGQSCPLSENRPYLLTEGEVKEHHALSEYSKLPTESTHRLRRFGRWHTSERMSPPIRVEVELLSTWGSEDRVGLTRLQFLDGHGRKLRVCAERDIVTAVGVSDVASLRTLFKLFTKKKSSVKRGWTCPFTSSPVSLIFLLVPRDGQISAVKALNYGGSDEEQDMGVRDMRLRLDGRVMFMGELRRGSSHPSVIKIISTNYPMSTVQSARAKNNLYLGCISRQFDTSSDDDGECYPQRSTKSNGDKMPTTSNVSNLPKWLVSFGKSGRAWATPPSARHAGAALVQDIDDASQSASGRWMGSARFGRRATPPAGGT